MLNKMSHWSRKSEAGTVLGMRILLLVHRFFGRSVFKVLLLPVIAYFYCSQKKARQASSQYLTRVTPFLDERTANKLSSFKHFLNFGDVLLDKLLVWMGEISAADVVFETPKIVEQVDNAKEGGIIIVSHLGNTEICSALAHRLPNMRLTLLVYTQHAKKFNSLMKKFSNSDSVELMQVTDISPATAMTLAERIDNGEFIVIAGDRTPVSAGSRTSNVTFLGACAPLPQGAFILASLLKCPVFLLFCLKQDKQYHIYFEQFSRRIKLPRKERIAALDEVVQLYAERLQYYCLKAPLQWFNFYPFWRESNDESKK